MLVFNLRRVSAGLSAGLKVAVLPCWILQPWNKSNNQIFKRTHLLTNRNFISCLAPPTFCAWSGLKSPGSLGSICPLPCVLFSSDPCWRSRASGCSVCVCTCVCERGGRGLASARGDGWAEGNSVGVERKPCKPLLSFHPPLHPSLVILAWMTWMNNRDVQQHRLPCCWPWLLWPGQGQCVCVCVCVYVCMCVCV